jgi:hypothetical protein
MKRFIKWLKCMAVHPRDVEPWLMKGTFHCPICDKVRWF